MTGFRLAVGADNVIFAIATDWLLAPLIILPIGHRRVKPTTLSSAEVENYLSYTSTSPRFHGLVLN